VLTPIHAQQSSEHLSRPRQKGATAAPEGGRAYGTISIDPVLWPTPLNAAEDGAEAKTLRSRDGDVSTGRA